MARDGTMQTKPYQILANLHHDEAEWFLRLPSGLGKEE